MFKLISSNRIAPSKMLFNFLNQSTSSNTYSFACITEKVSDNIYKASFDGHIELIFSKDNIEINQWVRFYGKRNGNVIVSEYIEILHGIDVNILRKSLILLRNN